MACPYCKQDVGHTAVGFTWWGGLIGARMIHHVQCIGCGHRYNGRTGQPNTTAIGIYIGAVSLLGFGLAYALLHH